MMTTQTSDRSSQIEIDVLVPFDRALRQGQHFDIGIDLAQARDRTVVTMAKKIWRKGIRYYRVGHFEIMPQNMPFEHQCNVISNMISRLQDSGGFVDTVTIDYTGIGRPVWEMLRRRKIPNLKGVLITGGEPGSGTQKGDIYHVPKIDLITGLQSLADPRLRRLIVHPDVPHAQDFENELRNYTVQYTETGRMMMNAKSGGHDDIVIATALTPYVSEYTNNSFSNWEGHFWNQGGGDDGDDSSPTFKIEIIPGNTIPTHFYDCDGFLVPVAADGTVIVNERTMVANTGGRDARWRRVMD
jgi:hypothetical protein